MSSGLDTPALRLAAAPTSLRATALTTLRGGIVSGLLQPGVTYSAPQLAEQLGVSATPVREAMLELAREGLVEPVRNKGFRVTEPTEAELDEITQLRSMIEVPAVALIAAGPRHAEAELLRDRAEQIVTAAAAGDLPGYLDADREFHLALLDLLGNALLVRTVGELRSRSRLFGLQSLLGTPALAASAAEHLQLVDLVAAGDVEGARALMQQHIGHVRGTWA